MDARARSAVDYLAVGHVTHDFDDEGACGIGGAVAYASAAAVGMGLRSAVVTRHGREVEPERCLPGVSWRAVRDANTTTFTNAYDAEGRRRQSLGALAAPLRAEDVPPEWRRVGILHVAPVMAEVDAAAVASVEAEFLGVTAQGWLRRVAEDRRVLPAAWSASPELLGRADAVVLSDEDLGGDVERFAWFARQVPIAVLTRGAAGATALASGRSWQQSVWPARASHPTGAGDVFAAVLFVRLWEGAPIDEALAWAAAAGSIAVEDTLAEGAVTRERIAARMRRSR